MIIDKLPAQKLTEVDLPDKDRAGGVTRRRLVHQAVVLDEVQARLRQDGGGGCGGGCEGV